MNTLESLGGWATGYGYATLKNKENEVKQGKNYYFSAMAQAAQIAMLGNVISKIGSLCSSRISSISLKIFASTAPLLSLPVLLTAASVKMDHYKNVAPFINDSLPQCIKIRLPQELSTRSIKVLNFLAEHTGNIVRVAIIALSIALIVLGNVHFGAGVLLAISYQSIDQMGFIPRKISLFMETHMPTVALIGNVVSGTIITKILIAPMLLSYIPGISRFLQHKGDAFLQKKFPNFTSNIKLTDIDAPVVVNKKLNFKEIKTILEARRSQYEINPSHCSKSVVGGSEYPRDNQFEKYNTLFDTINWDAKYKQLSPRLKDDERFIDFLKETYIDISKEDLQKNFDFYVKALATKKGISKEVYLANWAKEQMKILVGNLTGKTRVAGTQKDLEDALPSLSIILPHLENIQLSDRVQFEDILIKLAVEGGGYCSRGIKRAAEEIVLAMPQLGHTKKDAEIDAKKLYELKLEGVLQSKRQAIMQGTYSAFSQLMQQIMPQAIGQDVHTFDIFREILSLGFCPLSELERNAISFPVFINRHQEIYKDVMSKMYSEYESSLDECIKETNEVDFVTYIRDVINSNQSLSAEQRDDLEEMMGYSNKDFHLLALVMLGVLRKK